MEFINEFRVQEKDAEYFLCPVLLRQNGLLVRVGVVATYISMVVIAIMIFTNLLKFGFFFVALIPWVFAVFAHRRTKRIYQGLYSSIDNFNYNQKTIINDKEIIVKGRKTITYSWDDICWMEYNDYYYILFTNNGNVIPLKVEGFPKEQVDDFVAFLNTPRGKRKNCECDSETNAIDKTFEKDKGNDRNECNEDD